MRRLLAAFALSSAFAAGCGSSSSPASPPTPPPATPPSASAVNALADLPQDLAGPPGTRSFWDLGRGFALESGGGDQFVFPGAMQLHVGLPATPPTADSLPGDFFPEVLPFPYDQQAAELSFTTPVVIRGSTLWAVTGAGNELMLSGSLGVPATGGAPSGTRLSQAIDLTGATAPLTLGWSHHGMVLDGTIPGGTASWRVQVRDAASGNVLVSSAFTATTLGAGPVAPVDASPAAGHRVTLDFELLGSPRAFVAVDDVSLMGGATEHVVNGGFSGTLAPWTVAGPDQPCQVVSGKRSVNGLMVERRVFARPDRRWARFVDHFQNAGTSTVTTEASYLHELGAGATGDAVIQSSGGGKAFSAWDGSGFPPARRDLAVVFGTSPLAAAWRSASGLATGDGSPWAWTRFPLSVAPGQTRVVVQFVVLAEDRTGDSAPVVGSRALKADQEAAAIVASFWSDPDYREGMTSEELAALVNF